LHFTFEKLPLGFDSSLKALQGLGRNFGSPTWTVTIWYPGGNKPFWKESFSCSAS